MMKILTLTSNYFTKEELNYFQELAEMIGIKAAGSIGCFEQLKLLQLDVSIVM